MTGSREPGTTGTTTGTGGSSPRPPPPPPRQAAQYPPALSTADLHAHAHRSRFIRRSSLRSVWRAPPASASQFVRDQQQCLYGNSAISARRKVRPDHQAPQFICAQALRITHLCTHQALCEWRGRHSPHLPFSIHVYRFHFPRGGYTTWGR
jgi:hypothetical protein